MLINWTRKATTAVALLRFQRMPRSSCAFTFQCFEHLLHKAGLRQCPSEFNGIVHDGFRDTPHLIPLSEVNELGDLDHISSDVLVFDGKLMGQPGRTRTIGSGWGDEDLDVQVLLDLEPWLIAGIAKRS